MATDEELEIELVGQRGPAAGPAPERPLVVDDDPEDRYSRLRLIPWWDQQLLRNSRIMVVGAGALGNEILKNLALLGVGHVFVVDMDRIENSNLSRSVLYRASDEGSPKAEVAARQAMALNPDIKVQPFVGNVVYDLGLGAFRGMDVVIGGLDNREARLGINQACWKVNRPWIDGAIEVLSGIARVFVPPDGPCYECTMNETDYRLLNLRRSCALLSRTEMLAGKVPTTPTTSSVIAGIQVQEAVKLLHNRPDLPVLAGKGFFFNGLTHDSYVVEYQRQEFCLSHETFANIVVTELAVETATVGELLALARQALGPDAVLDFNREMVVALRCAACGVQQAIFRQLGKVTEADGRCPDCGEMRLPLLTHSVDGSEPYLELTLAQAGVPAFDILTGRLGFNMVHFELTGDRARVLGTVG